MVDARLRPERTLKHRVLSAGAWSLSGHGLSLVIRFASNLLMTRLLVPEMFGVMAIAGTVMAGLAMFSDLGVKLNIVQSSRGADPTFLNTAWVTQILRGILLWLSSLFITGIIFLLNGAGIISQKTAYADPSLPYVIILLSAGALISGAQSTKLYEASRNLSIDRLTKIDIGAQIVGLACTVFWALIDRSIWALVAGNICSTFVTTVLSHAWLPGTRNRWEWDRSAFREIVKFGRWISLSSILGFLAMNWDRLMLAGLVDSRLLGIYIIAFLIVNSVDQALTRIITDVAFPALSEVARERPPELPSSYYRFHFVIASVAYFSAVIFMVAGHSLVELLYDQRYQDAGWILQILGMTLFVVPFRLATMSFLVFGEARRYSILHAIRLTALLALAPIGFYFLGFGGALYGIVLANFLPIPMIVMYASKHKLFDLGKECAPLLGAFAGAIVGLAINLAIPLAINWRAWLGVATFGRSLPRAKY